ncbi:hypothetical protein L1987_34375 [Smallanthus sonchifolius]|uniref:Uncharacterized protein n=1 Tax=Smallanthus sonchifolius TaxID=185202 RepID=A0ACB9HVD6_9ASTR|nr:hypothetical protein L1987_34375 [Smallanthus sonchifolius]
MTCEALLERQKGDTLHTLDRPIRSTLSFDFHRPEVVNFNFTRLRRFLMKSFGNFDLLAFIIENKGQIMITWKNNFEYRYIFLPLWQV